MEVKVISKEDIKPSSPTPDHLKTLKLSLLDQLFPVPYAPIILFFSNNTNHVGDISTTSLFLKMSLSETLTRFYPLAGKIKDELSIDCNDQGAYFVETRVDCHLNKFLGKPELALLHKFLPCELVIKESNVGTHVTNIQVNVFECGGIAIGLCISHKIVDGAGLCTFLKAWAESTKRVSAMHETSTIVRSGDEEEAINPKFIAASLFPAKDLWLRDTSMIMWGSMFKLGRSVTKRFVFNASAIATLKAQATTSSVQHPTRVEVVTAFLWKSAMETSKTKHGTRRPSLLCHSVNLRRRASPPLPEHSLGNLIWIAAAKHCKANDDNELGTMKGMVGELRRGMSRIDGDFVKRLRSDQGQSAMAEGLKEIAGFGCNGSADHFGFSSWCKLGFYDEADFGWGRPVWVSSVASSGPVTMNLVILVDTRSGDGIEAWVTLDEQDMAIVERDQDLLSLASLDPSPLQY